MAVLNRALTGEWPVMIRDIAEGVDFRQCRPSSIRSGSVSS